LLTLVLAGRTSASQRLPTHAAGGRTHANWQQAVIGVRDQRWLE